MLMLHGKSRCCSKLSAEFSFISFISIDQRFIEQQPLPPLTPAWRGSSVGKHYLNLNVSRLYVKVVRICLFEAA